jgi:predicted GNAT family acetyltransferase
VSGRRDFARTFYSVTFPKQISSSACYTYSKQLIRRVMEADYELIDNEERRQYEFHVEKYTPKIEYMKSTNGEIYLTHTEVPTQLGGKGIGSQLVEKALKDIEKQGLRLVPLCPFVAGYIHKHPEWKRIVMKGIHIQ